MRNVLLMPRPHHGGLSKNTTHARFCARVNCNLFIVIGRWTSDQLLELSAGRLSTYVHATARRSGQLVSHSFPLPPTPIVNPTAHPRLHPHPIAQTSALIWLIAMLKRLSRHAMRRKQHYSRTRPQHAQYPWRSKPTTQNSFRSSLADFRTSRSSQYAPGTSNIHLVMSQ